MLSHSVESQVPLPVAHAKRVRALLPLGLGLAGPCLNGIRNVEKTYGFPLQSLHSFCMLSFFLSFFSVISSSSHQMSHRIVN
jgi:hypothetical protein